MKGQEVGMRKENHPIAQFKDNLQVIHAKGHWYSRKHEGRQGTRGLACGCVAGLGIITALDEDLPKLQTASAYACLRPIYCSPGIVDDYIRSCSTARTALGLI
jgi:hypothetical protein